MKKLIEFIIRLFKKPKPIKRTAGKKHIWIEDPIKGRIRKPC